MITTIFDAIIKSDRQGRGAAGETLAKDLLEKAGYEVRKPIEKRRGDLQAIDTQTGEFWNVEVKTAKKRPDGRWCFQLVCNAQNSTGRTDYRHADYVLLVALLSAGKVACYLIPVKKIGQRNTLTISNVNSGMWADYRVKRTVRL